MTTHISQKIQRFFVMLMLGSFSLSSHAADFYGATPIAVADLGTEFTTVFSRTINGRLGINALGVDLVQLDEQDATYNLDFGLNSWSALLDWHPFKSGFRFSGGLLHNEPGDREQVDPYTGLANANALSGNELGSLNSVVEFEGTSPYLGIGWGNALTKNGRLGLLVDLGVVFQDDADANLSSGLGQDASFRNTLDDYGYLPVFSLGLSYQFD
ncbi:MAG: hypothetical protein JKY90_00390 [Gammaproteobacteria bacterium]|nr:hypothetical protein [Gammaproteobacteria bacterium]